MSKSARLLEVEGRLSSIEAEIPASYYSDRDLPFRVKMLVDCWKRAVESNQRLEKEIEKSEARRSLALKVARQKMAWLKRHSLSADTGDLQAFIDALEQS